MEGENQKEQDGREQDRFELAVRDILNAVKELIELNRSFAATDLILTIKSAAELLVENHDEKNSHG